jgi:hypothetical protein
VFKKRFGLTTLALAAALALLTPTLASAHDRDDYRFRREPVRHDRCARGYYDHAGRWHRY